MRSNAFHWRIRDCILKQARCWGLRIFEPDRVAGILGVGNNYLISGCRFEGCGLGGALVGSDSAMFMNNRFDGNGMAFGRRGIRILNTATKSRLVSNYFSANTILDNSSPGETQDWGSIFI
jgi:hypothetical protein